MAEKQILSLKPTPRLEQSATNIPSACMIANIALNDAMIQPYGANPGRIEPSFDFEGDLIQILDFSTALVDMLIKKEPPAVRVSARPSPSAPCFDPCRMSGRRPDIADPSSRGRIWQ
jgi:hypothetical protein